MREQYREILEEAVASSSNREDFDEMLLRATKRHLPLRYHSHFMSMLQEILAEAENREMTNRQAAREILACMKGPPATDLAGRHGVPALVPSRTGPMKEVPAAEPIPVISATEGKPPAGPPVPPKGTQEAPTGAEGPPPEGEKGPEAPRILDLGGVRPDTLPPEMKDKLSKMVKAKKEKAEWDDASGDGTDAGLFFRGSQRCPPQTPPKKPAKAPAEKEEAERTAGKKEISEEE